MIWESIVLGALIGGALTAAITNSRQAEVSQTRFIVVNPEQKKIEFFDQYRRIEHKLSRLADYPDVKKSPITILISGIQFAQKNHLLPFQQVDMFSYICRHLITIRYYRNQLSHNEKSWEDIPNPKITMLDFLQALEQDIQSHPDGYRKLMRMGLNSQEVSYIQNHTNTPINAPANSNTNNYRYPRYTNEPTQGKPTYHNQNQKYQTTTRTEAPRNLINLSHTGIGQVPSEILEKRDLRILDISYNPISSLPYSIGDLYHLEKLNLSHTRVNSLPYSIGNLTNLREFNISGTDITSLPYSLGDLKNLRILTLSHTCINSLPYSLGNLSKLKILDISHTQITSIPYSLHDIPNLRIIQ